MTTIMLPGQFFGGFVGFGAALEKPGRHHEAQVVLESGSYTSYEMRTTMKKSEKTIVMHFKSKKTAVKHRFFATYLGRGG